MSRFEIKTSSLVLLGNLKAKVCKVVGGEEDIVEKDYNQDWQCIENILTRGTLLAARMVIDDG